MEKRWEQARVDYKEDLMHGRLARVLNEKFPEALPVAEDIVEWKKRLAEEKAQLVHLKATKQIKQPMYKAAKHEAVTSKSE
jgi:hypothetical protein